MKGLGRVWIFTGLATASLLGAQPIRVLFDVKPGDEPTTVEPDREGMMPAAVLSSAQFDAAAIDTRTIRVGPTGMEAEPVRTMSDDVNRDNRPDLLMLVRVQDLRLKCGDKLIRITAKTKSQADIEGSERVVLEGCPP